MEKRRLSAEKEAFEKTRVYPSLVIKWKCDKCHDTGFLEKMIVDSRGNFHGELVTCDCTAETRRKARDAMYLKLCRLPEARPEWTLENFKARPGYEELVKAVWSVARDDGLKWLILLSPSGHGKTHLAVGICRKWLGRGKSARYVYVPDLVNELRQGFDETGTNSYRSKMDFFKNVGLLALDDLGVENSTPWVNEQIDTIVDYRYVNKLPLVVTTNKALDDPKMLVRVADRLKRIELDGIGKTIVLHGLSYQEYIKTLQKK